MLTMAHQSKNTAKSWYVSDASNHFTCTIINKDIGVEQIMNMMLTVISIVVNCDILSSVRAACLVLGAIWTRLFRFRIARRTIIVILAMESIVKGINETMHKSIHRQILRNIWYLSSIMVSQKYIPVVFVIG
jgi:hypothetical protein